jgi:hypothetical protein
MKSSEHWEKIYRTQGPEEMSWTQAIPAYSIKHIESLGLPKSSSIIDIGGGDSNLVDILLERGYTDITVLDISSAALERAKMRLGAQADRVQWIHADINEFTPDREYSIWHDRAAFHFLTTKGEKARYIQMAGQYATHLVISTFSENGPLKCSGLEICRYEEADISDLFSTQFQKLKCEDMVHETPFGTHQAFRYCSFRKAA